MLQPNLPKVAETLYFLPSMPNYHTYLGWWHLHTYRLGKGCRTGNANGRWGVGNLDILKSDSFTLSGNLEQMTNREQLMQELEQAPDDLVQTVLDFLHRVKATRQEHPLAKFAGILSDSEAEELQQAIAAGCRQVDLDEW